MRIFITGATGFIGTNLLKRLSKTHHEITILARKSSDVSIAKEIGVIIIYGDIKDKVTVYEGMKFCDWVIHLAGSYSFWARDAKDFADVNIFETQNVMEAALKNKVSKVVSVSSATIWGNAQWPITEKTPYGTERESDYARTKFVGDLISLKLYEEKGLPLTMIYPSAVIGPNDPSASGRYIINLALGLYPGQFLTKSYISMVYVDDVVEVIVKAVEKNDNVGEKYIVSAGNLIFGDINKVICDISGKKSPHIKFPNWLTIAILIFSSEEYFLRVFL